MTSTAVPEVTYLRIGHSTSHARDTYGYPIVRLTDETTQQTVRCMGGGYDMLGTVLADWAVAAHSDLLTSLASRAYYRSAPDKFTSEGHPEDALYGVTAHYDADGLLTRVTIDGACGEDSVHRALIAAGIRAERTHTRRGTTTGWLVTIEPPT